MTATYLIKTLAEVSGVKEQTIEYLVESLAGQSNLFSEAHLTRRLQNATVHELQQVKGIGLVAAQRIHAAISLSKQLSGYKQPGDTIDSPLALYEAIPADIRCDDQEHIVIILVDVKHRLKVVHLLTTGSHSETLCSPRDVFRFVLKNDGQRFFIAHNHPSGSVDPSEEDIALIRCIYQGAKVLDLHLLDHLVVSSAEYHSIRQSSDIWAMEGNV